ncbi:MAG: hypothetical protein DMG00_22130 [Acidobacteria bacterium]|nr:MAG: hypothetical protein DMG00_22130 [Acidobacteriota bacterium]
MYVCAENGGGGPVSTNRSAAGPWESFRRFMSTDGRVQYLCFDGVHFLRVRTDLAQPVVDATGVAQGFTFRRLNTLASLTERARIRGSMFTARFPMSLGPRPGQPSNILAMVAMPFLPQSEQDAAFGAYLDRGYTHAVSGPIVDPGGNHGIYPPSDFTQADAFNRYLDVLERGSTRGLQWIHFVKPDNWTLDEVQRELEPLYRQPRAQELLGLVIPAGWEQGRFRRTKADGGAFFRWGRDVFPNSAIGIHMRRRRQARHQQRAGVGQRHWRPAFLARAERRIHARPVADRDTRVRQELHRSIQRAGARLSERSVRQRLRGVADVERVGTGAADQGNRGRVRGVRRFLERLAGERSAPSR